MINQLNPDFQDTPASDSRPTFAYHMASAREPLVSIVTPYYNTCPVFWETFRALQRMSLPYWEWLIVDDGSSDPASLAQLDEAQRREPRIRVLRQPNGGPAVARNHAAREARGRYLMILDSDDLVEPTFVEQAVWFLETQPADFAAVNSWNVTFGAKNFLWPRGFDHGADNIRENSVTNQSVVRKDAWLAIGGFDERVSYEHADWDFWLTLADKGLWGYTLPAYLTWYRTQERSLLTEIEADHERGQRFRAWLEEKHRGLERRFPRVKPLPAGVVPPAERHATIPLANPLAKPAGVRRVLLIAPWLQVGGADRFNLDMIEQLRSEGYEFTVVTTLRDENPWLSEFTRLTPDVFALHTFLNLADHPRFTSYLIESRQIDAVIVSNSEFGYALLPYLRARHPGVALLDYTHSDEPGAPLGGFPGLSVAAGADLDLRLTTTDYLRQWMIARDAPPTSIQVRRCAVDLEVWRGEGLDRETIRGQLGLEPDRLTLLFVGRMSHEKRPLLFLAIVRRLVEQGHDVQAVAIGDGPDLPAMKRFVRRRRLGDRVRLLGAQNATRIREVMVAADVLVMPSEREGLSIALMEGMAMGLVPVVSNVGGQSELAQPGGGYLITPGPDEINAYAEAIADIARHPERGRARAERARATVAQHHDLRAFAPGLDASFQQAGRMAGERRAAGQTHSGAGEAANAANAAIQRVAVQDRVAEAWAQGQRVRLIRGARSLRQRILPQGSPRYEVYRRFRVLLRQMRFGAAP